MTEEQTKRIAAYVTFCLAVIALCHGISAFVFWEWFWIWEWKPEGRIMVIWIMAAFVSFRCINNINKR